MGHNTFNYFLLEFLQSMENACIVILISMESSDLKYTFFQYFNKILFSQLSAGHFTCSEEKNHNHITINFIISTKFSICYLYWNLCFQDTN